MVLCLNNNVAVWMSGKNCNILKENIMSKKRVLIVVPSFSIGGTIVSLHALLSLMDTSKYEIDVFALSRSGEYLERLPNCRVLPENIWLSLRYFGRNPLKKFFVCLLRFFRVGLSKIGISIVPLLCKIGGRQLKTDLYDVVISYVESINPIVCYYPARKRIAWIHCDYGRHLALAKKRNEEKAYLRFEHIVCVSEFAKSVFCKFYPNLSSRVHAIHNVINEESIRLQAQKNSDLDSLFKTDRFTLVSVGRLDPVKQFDKIPYIAAEIKKLTAKPFYWYIIGGSRGFQTVENKIRNDIINLDMSDNVVLLGEKSNVYPYMAKADLYVSTSLSESFPLVINEAKALGIPIVSNNFGSASESIEDGVDGYIVPIESMADVIVRLMENKSQMQLLKENLSREKYNNSIIIESINSFL